MIIQFTIEEQDYIQEIQDKYTPEWDTITKELHATENEEKRKALLIERQLVYDHMEEELDAFSEQCQRERFAQIAAEGTDAIISNAKEQAPIIIRRIHATISLNYDGLLEQLSGLGIGTVKKDKLYLNADYTAEWLKSELRLHMEALRDNKPALRNLLTIIIESIDQSPYTDSEGFSGNIEDLETLNIKFKSVSITPDSAIFKANMPMYHGKATDALAKLSDRKAIPNPIADKAVIEAKEGDYKVVIQNFSRVKGKVSINTHKLFSAGVAEFTQINNYGGGSINPKISIPFDEYARLLGYRIDEQEMDSPEAAAKEKKRALEAKKKAKQRIRQDLELLQAMRWTWQEKVKGKVGDFDSILLFERVAIRKGYIIMEFGRNMAEYLKQNPLTQYPRGLLSIDARSENAYRIGLKMAEHYSIDNNQVKGTANRLKVSTLLAVTALPTIEMLQNEKQDNSRQWYARIKEPFETALDVLTGKVIKSWEYVKAKGEPLTDKEAYNITDYETFTSLLVQFELIEAPEHEERLERRAKEKKAAAAKKAAKEKTKTSKKQT